MSLAISSIIAALLCLEAVRGGDVASVLYGNVIGGSADAKDEQLYFETAQAVALQRLKRVGASCTSFSQSSNETDARFHVASLHYSQGNDGLPSPVLTSAAGKPSSDLGAVVDLKLRVTRKGAQSSLGNSTEISRCDGEQDVSGTEELHSIRVDLALLGRRQDTSITLHTWSPAQMSEKQAPRGDLRILSYNSWNSNPPRWLWRHPGERFRQYALRLARLSDVLAETAPDILALQEVRYDSTLGGFDSFSGIGESLQSDNPTAMKKAEKMISKILSGALKQVEEWRKKSKHEVLPHKNYLQLKDNVWREATSSPYFRSLVASHPQEAEFLEGKRCGGLVSGNETAIPVSPFLCTAEKLDKTAPTTSKRLKAALKRSPHAQVEHILAALPKPKDGHGGWQYVFQPAQLYLDPNRWNNEHEPHRDEEGPAIFSRFPIIATHHLLLSKAKDESEDPADTHQRVCLHALIAIPANNEQVTLVDVYSVHMPLSEKARDRGVKEIAAFIRETSSLPMPEGVLGGNTTVKRRFQVLAGDMNAEPQEKAMRWLVGDRDGGDGPEQLPKLCKLRESAYRVCSQGDVTEPRQPLLEKQTSVVVNAEGGVTVAAEATAKETPFRLIDAYHAQHQQQRFSFDNATVGSPVEYPPAINDAALKRYFYTFPCDNPSKRIDMVFLSPSPTQPSAGVDGAPTTATSPGGVRVKRYFLAGQDAMAGTDAHHEGSGAPPGQGSNQGMVHARSPIWASDHRAVAVDLELD
jgi:endonuclease/exonuclease/phosphatase family metal-dependent hydrolase